MPNEPSPNKPTSSKLKRKKPLLTVGWREWLELPDLGIPAFKAKVDTGARTSALHAVNVKVMDDKVRFSVQSVMTKGKHTKLELPLHDMRRIRSSNGKSELRPVVKTMLLMGGQRWPIEVTLTRRDSMEFRMLLGREALRKHALVDVSRSYALGTPASAENKAINMRLDEPSPESKTELDSKIEEFNEKNARETASQP